MIMNDSPQLGTKEQTLGTLCDIIKFSFYRGEAPWL